MSLIQAAAREYAAPLRAVDETDATRREGVLVATATKRIDPTDPYLAAHFPGRTVYPGIFILETVRQAVLAALGERDGGLPDLTAVHSMRFFRGLHPGELLSAEVVIGDPDSDGELRAEARCHRDGLEAARLSLGFGYGYGTAPGQRSAGTGSQAAASPRELVDQGRIRTILPHGPQMVLVDRAEVIEPRQRLRAVKTVGGSELCYQHLRAGTPGERYAYPVSLMIESFGQAAVLLWHSAASEFLDRGDLLMFAAAKQCRFEGRAYPGDVLRHEVRLERSLAATGFAAGETWVGDRRIATLGSLIAVARPPSLGGSH